MIKKNKWDGIWRNRHIEVLDSEDCVVKDFYGDVEWVSGKTYYGVKYEGKKYYARKTGSHNYTIKPSDTSSELKG